MKKRITALALALAMVMGTAALAAGVEKTVSITPMDLTINGQAVTPTKSDGTPADVFAYEGTTYAPVRYLCELLGIDVEWDKNDTGTVKLVGVDGITAAASYTPGTYTGTAMGFGGPVTVEATVSADAITEVKVTGDDETPTIGGAILAPLGRLAASQGLEMDTITGATYTSRGVKDALTVALAKAQGKAVAAPADGKYTVNAIGHEGIIVVTTMFQGGKIKSVTINSQSETEGVGTYAIDRIPALSPLPRALMWTPWAAPPFPPPLSSRAWLRPLSLPAAIPPSLPPLPPRRRLSPPRSPRMWTWLSRAPVPPA